MVGRLSVSDRKGNDGVHARFDGIFFGMFSPNRGLDHVKRRVRVFFESCGAEMQFDVYSGVSYDGRKAALRERAVQAFNDQFDNTG